MASFLARRPAADSSRSKRPQKRRNRKDFQLQKLEDRNLMAVSPQLVAVIPNAGGLILPGEAPRHEAPTQLVFRFDEGQIIQRNSILGNSGIMITRSGGDGIFGNGNDVVITPGYKDIGDRPNEVVVRFADPLPDDVYRATLFGSGALAITNTDPDPFNNGVDVQVTFELDLGANVVAVVPQPITRGAGNVLTQARNQIVVYFNDDNLNVASAQSTSFYQLIQTGKTGTNIDDQVFFPTSVVYNAATDTATLSFSTDIALLGGGAGAYRLRVGSTYNNPIAPSVTASVDTGSSFTATQDLGTLGTQTVVVQGLIAPEHFALDLPGSPEEPGHRETSGGNHFLDTADIVDGITTYYYNFQEVLGLDADGFPAYSNVITPTQRQRAREAFELWGRHLGVQFVETADTGVTIATGDLEILLGISDVGAPLFLVDRTGLIAPHGLPTVLLDVAEPWGDSEYGGDYFESVMSGIGEFLGLGISWDLPGMNVMGSQDANGNAQGNYLSNTNGVERIFPGDADILHGQYLYRPESKDIDVYSFTLATGGTIKLETVAERLGQTSLLDTVITVYNSQHQIVARNDDYFSSDSFLELNLGSGTYYVAISSTGNTDYDLGIEDSGFGGTTQGTYDLRITFNQEQTSGITDTTGTLIDGDGDGLPGGAYNFWLTVATQANTIYVDKAATATVGTIGTIGRPYTNIASAFAVATPGKVVRIVGNGGTDGNLATLGDNRAYEIGFAQTGSPNTLQDGSTMRVPKGVTVMIDAGAVFKLRRANIDVGSLSQGIDRSEGALQVLGTPTNSVVFTSYHNQAVGVDTYPPVTTPVGGDWGGIVVRNQLDYEEGRTVLETQGIFLNYINHADITYGGGDVLVASDQAAFSPIHLVESRPTISYNKITLSAQAAISADPNSFEETRFYDTANTFELQYNRVGPDIDFNSITGNSINGLFVRIATLPGEPIKTLTKQARFDDNIVHVLTETLNIAGTPGGPGSETFSPAFVGDYGPARLDARLKIDAGMVLKLSNSRIETQIGSQLIAEGTANRPVIFTSLLDDRFGASGTFDTSTSNVATTPVAGDWAGLYFAPNSTGSLDHTLITYAGGSSAIEGTFVNFNAIEIHSADVRIANSSIENNADGFDASDLNRNGRGQHTAATIFIRGAQPIIVNNIIRNNLAAAISVNVNSLNNTYLSDYGRSTGTIELFSEQRINQGPLVRLNRLANNQINGMVIRAATLTTESVWDDTDIVHVVQGEIAVPNFHSFGGLRLQSSPTESLVVKLQGANAGFTAGGTPADITDRIGGTVQVLGFPGQPVVLTSLLDDRAGAGIDPNSNTMFDTNNDGGASVPAPGDWRSVRLDQYSNDRNVAVVRENENVVGNNDVNGSTLTAQNLGQLARNEKESDDTLRLGFEVNGYLASVAPGDVDVYSFKARPRTEVWIDLDMTRMALDSIVELIDAEGNVISTSNNSLDETLNPVAPVAISDPRPLQRDTFNGKDFYSFNPRDAGMRVVLPGPVNGTATTYYVRVRANSATPLDPTAGETTGQYRLQVRLREVDEKPGSTVQFADIRYANRGVEVLGKPGHSPLTGEAAEYLETAGQNNDVQGNAQYIGNLLYSDRYALGIAGGLTDGNDIDWYQMDVQSPIGSNALVSTIFDIDYADQLGRPDLRLAVYNAAGQLILVLNNSNVADDRPGPTAGNNLDDLSRGSIGTGDPFMGPVNLPVGSYFVAVSYTGRQPTAALQSTNGLVRLEPVNSINRVIEDHIGFTGGSISSASGALFPGTTVQEVNAFADEFHLGDVVFYVNTGDDLYVVNPFTGFVEYDVTGAGVSLQNSAASPFIDYRDIAMRSDGRLYTLTVGNANFNLNQAAISGNYRELSTYNGAVLSSVDDGIVAYQANPANPVNANGTLNLVAYNQGVGFEALAHQDDNLRHVFAVGNINPAGLLVPASRNLLYILDADGKIIPDPSDAAPTDPEVPTDQHARGRLLTAPTLIPARATDISAAGNDLNFTNPGDLLDGHRFTITDSDGNTVVFEFDSGPDVRGGEYGAQAVRDGMTFTMGDGVNTYTFEYDSGPVLNLPAGALAGAIVNDGDVITLFDNTTPTPVGVNFEFDNDGTLNNPANTTIAFTNANPRATLVTSIVTAINAHAFGVVATASVGGTNPYLGRISFENDTVAVTTIGGGTAMQGNYGISNAAFKTISFEETNTWTQFGTSTVNAVQTALAPIRAGFAARTGGIAPLADMGTIGDRLSFYGATTYNFAGMAGALTVQNSTAGGPSATGIRATSQIAVPFDAGDTDFDLATAMANAINSAAVIFANPDPLLAFNVSAEVVGNSVELTGATTPTVDGGEPVFAGGSGPGGTITGLAFMNGDLYAVTDNGGLYIVNNPTSYQTTLGTGPSLTYVATSTDLLNIPFSGLSAGPENVENGRYANMFFATTDDGEIVAFNTEGELQPIFIDGQSRIDTGVPDLKGLAFSPVDYNLWHVTNARGADLGHGIEPTYDGTRGPGRVQGGSSFYFGLEDPRLTTTISNQPGAINFAQRGTAVGPDGNPGVFQSYDVPGGAAGTLTTDTFSLKNYSATDQPVLYFNYYFDGDQARDVFRVHASVDGANWSLLGTQTADTGGWRQARVGLGGFAGLDNIRLRFEFLTSGDSNIGASEIDGSIFTTGSLMSGVLGSEIDDGDSFSLTNTLNLTTEYEFDLGFTLLTPAGAGTVIADGDTFTVQGPLGTQTFEFNKTGGTVGLPIDIVNTDSADDVATLIANAINAAGIGVTALVADNRLQLVDAIDVTVPLASQLTLDSVPGTLNPAATPIMARLDMTAEEIAQLVAQVIDQVYVGDRTLTAVDGATLNDGDTFILDDGANAVTFEFNSGGGVTPGNVAIPFLATDSAILVADAMRTAINGSGLNITAGGTDHHVPLTGNVIFFDPDTSSITINPFTIAKVEETTMHVIGLIIDFSDLPFYSPTTANNVFAGDPRPRQGFGNENFSTNAPGNDNRHEGIYIDDFIIGFAERGEMVTGATVGDVGFTAPLSPIPPGGAYDLEIRRATDYTVGEPPPVYSALLVRQWDTNERLTNGFSLTAQRGSALSEGERFIINDGVNVHTYEFDTDGVLADPLNRPIVFNAAMTDIDVGIAIAAAINATKTAGLSASTAAAGTGGSIVYIFNSSSVDALAPDITSVTLTEEKITGLDNDTIATAAQSGLSSANRGSIVLDGKIGDNPELTDPGLDVDMIAVQLNAGETLIVDTDSDVFGNYVNTVITLFDEFGLQLDQVNNDYAPGESQSTLDSYLEFIALTTGTYYIAITSSPNLFFDPFTEESGFLPGGTGEYQVTISVGATTGILYHEYQDVGDSNRFRDQGYTILNGNRISNTLDYGIVVDADTRTANGNQTFPAPVRNLREPNVQRTVPGVSLTNNIIYNLGTGGILLSGDTNANPDEALASVLFARATNNTIYGGATATGIGIRVEQNSFPTLLNNVLANLAVGIQVDTASGGAVEIGGSAYSGNTANTQGTGGLLGQSPIQIAVGAPLFINPAAGNFYPAPNAAIIDSSINTLPERANMITVTDPLKIAQSSIQAPERDAYGLLRVNDTTVNSPPGLGSDVFKDRGAIDRADPVGPTATLVNPVDNDAGGLDVNPNETVVQYLGPPLNFFSIQLVDGVQPVDPSFGVGVDDTTVSSASVVVTKDGNPLVVGVDYIFSYNTTTDTIRIEPTTGFWLPGTYVVTLNNSTVNGIKDLAGNSLKANQTVGGATQFTIQLPSRRDYGDAPASYGTLLANNGARHGIVDGFHLGTAVSEEFDGQPTPAGANNDTFDDGAAFATQLIPGQNSTLNVTTSGNGRIDAFVDFNGDGDFLDAGEKILNSVVVTTGINALTFAVPSGALQGAQTYARVRFSSAGGLGPTGDAPDGEVEDLATTIGFTSPWQHHATPGSPTPIDANIRFDVSGDLRISIFDVSTLSFHIRFNPLGLTPIGPNAFALPVPPTTPGTPPPYLDVNGDNVLSMADILQLAAFLRFGPSPEGPDAEGEEAGAPAPLAGAQGEAAGGDEVAAPSSDPGSKSDNGDQVANWGNGAPASDASSASDGDDEFFGGDDGDPLAGAAGEAVGGGATDLLFLIQSKQSSQSNSFFRAALAAEPNFDPASYLVHDMFMQRDGDEDILGDL